MKALRNAAPPAPSDQLAFSFSDNLQRPLRDAAPTPSASLVATPRAVPNLSRIRGRTERGDASPVIRLDLGPSRRASRTPPTKSPLPRLVTAKDMPAYADTEVDAVERVISDIPSERALLGYREIQGYFGVSKATANRRMKEGLVPGVRIKNGVVLRDGGVRRLSREQVKWLLLAVRSNRNGGRHE